MQRLQNLFLCILMVLAYGSARPYHVSAQEPGPAQDVPVVHAVMFWMDGCPHCQQVLDNVLPPLQEKYGDQFKLQLVELVTSEDVDRLYQLAAAYKIPKEQAGVPFLVIGDRVLIGSGEIPAELPGLIESYLASGGVALPDITRLIETRSSPEPIPSAFTNGFWLAISASIFMLASLLFAAVAFVRGASKLPSIFSKRWMQPALPLLCLIGLAVAGYLAYVETQAVSAVCGPVGDCNAVQSSPYARLFGILPIGVLGMVGYLAILAAWLYNRLRHDRIALYMPMIVFGMTIFGVFFSLYLTFLELFVIKAVCIWCITSAVIMTLLMYLSLQPALQSMDRLQETDYSHAEIETTSQ